MGYLEIPCFLLVFTWVLRPEAAEAEAAEAEAEYSRINDMS